MTVTLTDIYNFSINLFPGVFHSWKLFKEKALELRINLIHSSNFSWFSLPLHDVSFSLVSQISHFKIDSPTIYEDISFSQSPSEWNLASMLSFFGSWGKLFSSQGLFCSDLKTKSLFMLFRCFSIQLRESELFGASFALETFIPRHFKHSNGITGKIYANKQNGKSLRLTSDKENPFGARRTLIDSRPFTRPKA